MNKTEIISDIVNSITGMDSKTANKLTRKRETVINRQLKMFALRKYTGMSLAEIGWYCGNKDHATVLHAEKTINDLVKSRYNGYDFQEKYNRIIYRCEKINQTNVYEYREIENHARFIRRWEISNNRIPDEQEIIRWVGIKLKLKLPESKIIDSQFLEAIGFEKTGPYFIKNFITHEFSIIEVNDCWYPSIIQIPEFASEPINAVSLSNIRYTWELIELIQVLFKEDF